MPILEKLERLAPLGNNILPQHSYGQPYERRSADVQALLTQVTRITKRCGYPLHLSSAARQTERLNWVVDLAERTGSKITLNSSHFGKRQVQHMTNGTFSLTDKRGRKEWDRFLDSLDRAKARIDDSMVDSVFFFDFETLQYLWPDTAVAVTNNIDLLILQSNMYDAVKQRWPDMRVNWYNHHHVLFGESKAPQHRWKTSPHTCPLTPGDGWGTVALYDATAKYETCDMDITRTAENGLRHGQVNGYAWIGPGYATDHSEYRGRAKRASVDFQPTSKIWWQWGRCFTHGWWNLPASIRHDRFFQWEKRLDGIVLYPPAGGRNFLPLSSGLLTQWHYLYQYFRGLKGMSYDKKVLI